MEPGIAANGQMAQLHYANDLTRLMGEDLVWGPQEWIPAGSPIKPIR